MKYIIAIIAITFIACKGPVTFDRPQPDNTPDLINFPEKITGNYLSSDKNSILTIHNNSIIRTTDYDGKELKDSLDSSYILKGDTIYNKYSSNKEKVVIKGDTILHHIHLSDTLFVISDSGKLKHFRGYYFLNIKEGKDSWVVQKLSLHKGVLTIGNIADSTDLHKLQEITETQNDSIAKPFSLSKRQFKKFLRNDGFREENVYTKITLTK